MSKSASLCNDPASYLRSLMTPSLPVLSSATTAALPAAAPITPVEASQAVAFESTNEPKREALVSLPSSETLVEPTESACAVLDVTSAAETKTMTSNEVIGSKSEPYLLANVATKEVGKSAALETKDTTASDVSLQKVTWLKAMSAKLNRALSKRGLPLTEQDSADKAAVVVSKQVEAGKASEVQPVRAAEEQAAYRKIVIDTSIDETPFFVAAPLETVVQIVGEVNQTPEPVETAKPEEAVKETIVQEAESIVVLTRMNSIMRAIKRAPTQVKKFIHDRTSETPAPIVVTSPIIQEVAVESEFVSAIEPVVESKAEVSIIKETKGTQPADVPVKTKLTAILKKLVTRVKGYETPYQPQPTATA